MLEGQCYSYHSYLAWLCWAGLVKVGGRRPGAECGMLAQALCSLLGGTPSLTAPAPFQIGALSSARGWLCHLILLFLLIRRRSLADSTDPAHYPFPGHPRQLPNLHTEHAKFKNFLASRGLSGVPIFISEYAWQVCGAWKNIPSAVAVHGVPIFIGEYAWQVSAWAEMGGS